MIEADVEIARQQSFVSLMWSVSHRPPASLEFRAQEVDVEAGKPGRPKLEPCQIVEVVTIARGIVNLRTARIVWYHWSHDNSTILALQKGGAHLTPAWQSATTWQAAAGLENPLMPISGES